MGHVQIWRSIILTLCFLINFPATGFTAHYLFVTVIPGAGPFIHAFQILGLVAGVIAMLLIPALLNGKITVMFDLTVMGILWVLWLAESILAAQFLQKFFKESRLRFLQLYGWFYEYGYVNRPLPNLRCTSVADGYCYEIYIIQNLMITLFVLSFIHFVGLLIYAIVKQQRGQPIWNTRIRRINEPQNPPFVMQQPVPWQATMPVGYGHPVQPGAWGIDANGPQSQVPLNKELTNV
ncbi:hypothetical protein BJ165DRAFT_1525802 [Panaeolus papilionaceus]|nr:hypothetical protein BJ165DRAFT_1525802 [Panaeolus papilionaceus]